MYQKEARAACLISHASLRKFVSFRFVVVQQNTLQKILTLVDVLQINSIKSVILPENEIYSLKEKTCIAYALIKDSLS